MGTNYYLKTYAGPIMLASGESSGIHELHIGKSSGGWCFALHVYPQFGIHDLDDWIPLLNDTANSIENEYGDVMLFEELLKNITERHWSDSSKWSKPLCDPFYIGKTWTDFFHSNHAEPGPNGLLRHRVEVRTAFSYLSGCIKQGDGTWDCIIGDFS